MDSVVVAKVAVFAIFPNVARVGIEKRVVAAGAIRELDPAEASLRRERLHSVLRRLRERPK